MHNTYIYVYIYAYIIYIYIQYIFVHVCLSAFNAQLAPSFARQLFENSFACIRQLWASWPVPKKYSSWTSPKKWTLKVGKKRAYIYILYIYIHTYIMRMQCVYNFITNDDLGACLKYSLTFNHRNVMMIPPDFFRGWNLKPPTLCVKWHEAHRCCQLSRRVACSSLE